MPINFLEKFRFAPKVERTRSAQDYINQALNLRSMLTSQQQPVDSGHEHGVDASIAGKILGSGEVPVSGKYRISQGNTAGHSKGHGAQAWDYAVPVGTPAVSRVNGTVIRVQDLGNKSYGKHVYVKGADGRTYIYAHLSGFAVKKGQQVKAGQAVGLTGSSGKSSGPHLHFEIR